MSAPPAPPPTIVLRPSAEGDGDLVLTLWRDAGWSPPPHQIEAARLPGATLLVGCEGDRVVGALLAWIGTIARIDGLAVRPERQRQGIGQSMLAAAEAWLAARGARAVEVLLPDIGSAHAFFGSVGYLPSGGLLLRRSLLRHRSPDAIDRVRHPLIPPEHLPRLETQAGKLRVAVTFLALEGGDQRPHGRPRLPRLDGNPSVALVRLRKTPLAYYRYLYAQVGGPWLWYERRRLDDATLAELILRPGVDIFVLMVDGAPAGYFELFRPDAPGESSVVKLEYFGLVPEFLGQGLGPFLLDSAVEAAFAGKPRPSRLLVNTCSLDHPRALTAYQKAGFVPYRQETIWIEDPRLDPANGFPPP